MDLCKRTKDHVKALMKSSKANMALMFSEQGNHFELYDKHSNIYQGTDLEEVDIPISYSNRQEIFTQCL